MSGPKMWDAFVEWLDQEVRDPTSPLYGTIESIRQARKDNDGRAYVAAIKRFGAECYIQGLVDAGWQPPPSKIKQVADRLAVEAMLRANQS